MMRVLFCALCLCSWLLAWCVFFAWGGTKGGAGPLPKEILQSERAWACGVGAGFSEWCLLIEKRSLVILILFGLV